MANNYGIPYKIEETIRRRDTKCVYCGKDMINPRTGGARRDWATIDHLNHLPPFQYRIGQTEADFAICCWNCNCVLRKDKPLSVWLNKECAKKDGVINVSTIAPIIQEYLKRRSD